MTFEDRTWFHPSLSWLHIRTERISCLLYNFGHSFSVSLASSHKIHITLCFIQKSMTGWCLGHPGSYPAMFSFANQYQGRVSSEEGITQNKPQLGHCRNDLQHNTNYRSSSFSWGWGIALPELAVQSWSEQSRHEDVGVNDLDVKTVRKLFFMLNQQEWRLNTMCFKRRMEMWIWSS